MQIREDGDFEVLYSSLPQKRADLLILILASQNIPVQAIRNAHRFDLYVHKKDRSNAMDSIQQYDAENRLFRMRPPPIPPSFFLNRTTFIIMLIMCLVHGAGLFSGLHDQLVLKFGASSLFIRQGQTYRAITALFLHTDVRHLAGNLAGLVFFAGPVISITGYGIGTFFLLYTAAFANLVNAQFHKTAFLSIGASTLVMSAMGLLTAWQLTRTKDRHMAKGRLFSVVAGMTLVAFFSQGERTDIGAHILGFLSGLFWGLFFLPANRVLTFRNKNLIGLCMVAWILILSILSAVPIL